MFQEDRLIGHLSALKNLKLVMPVYDRGRAEELLSRMGLAGSMDQPVRSLSGGMARRVAIARCLAVNADICLMDEPLKGLDVDTKSAVLDVIKRETERRTLMLVTHDAQEAKSLGGRIINFETLIKLTH